MSGERGETAKEGNRKRGEVCGEIKRMKKGDEEKREIEMEERNMRQRKT